MESNNPDADIGDKCNINGNCSPPPKKPTIDLNHANNIDDISTPSELKFDDDFDFVDPDVTEKRREIEECLLDPDSTNLEQWQNFAKSKGGLISDEYRRKIWPLLVGVTTEEMTEPPSLDELSTHSEYNQVVLDVNRSLKRFPPGIPYEQRVALQDQLTVLILRVIIRHPHLKYYQGYHDVAITLLLVCGDRASFPLLCRLSYGPGAPLAPFMQTTMQPTQHLLNYMLPVVRRADQRVAGCLEKAGVGTMFALPWYLTWFGHSLNRYSDVVRLYDYFLCAPPLFPVYVTAAIVLHRQQEVFACDCDMAMLHCLLSRLPDDLPFEDILVTAKDLYAENDPVCLEPEVDALERRETEQRLLDDERMKRRRAAAAAARNPTLSVRIQRTIRLYMPTALRTEQRLLDDERMKRRRAAAAAARNPTLSVRIQRTIRLYMPTALRYPLTRRAILATATVLIGVYVYYRPDLFNRRQELEL